MNKKLKEKYANTVVKQFKENADEAYATQRKFIYWNLVGRLIPSAAFGWCIGTIFGYVLVGYFILKFLGCTE